MLSACASDQGQSGGREEGNTNTATEEYSVELPGEIAEGETVYITSNNAVYECTRTQGDAKKVQCKHSSDDANMGLHKDKGMSLHRQK